ncbi:protease [Candidatus Marinamargulisbacteria bacterium SCGC AG-414-C22]|nr:protease [Candidatus Marinamargulisbacteria bacterium SCGC AG-414-C22]RAP31922.1 protease [Candidatus Marinamargulisbacteria bacterium SCGC AG-414-C22]
MKKILLLLCLSFSLISSNYAAFSNDVLSLKKTSQTFNKVAENGIAAVVSISAVMGYNNSQDPMYNDPFFRYFFGEQPQGRQSREGIGSGVIVSTDGHILTNHHVIDKAAELSVRLSDGREFEASIVGTDPKTDLALLKISPKKNLPVIELGESDQLKVGDWAIAIGNPFGLQGTVTVGIISGLGRAGVVDTDNYASFIQTDAAINPGNSGGALLNIDGELIGINTAIFSRSGGYMGIGFAVPVNTAKRVMEDLLLYGNVQRGLLGVSIQPINDAVMEEYNLRSRDGALVVDVEPNSSADQAGIKRGDVIIKLGNKKITDFLSLRSEISELRVGDVSTITVIRKGRQKTLSFVLLGDQSKEPISKATFDKLGLQLSKNTTDLQTKYQLFTTRGLVITAVQAGSIAAKNQFKAGYVVKSVNGEQVQTIQQYRSILNQSDIYFFVLDINGYDYRVMIRPE